MSFCTNCGAKLNEGAKFCHSCGCSASPDLSNNNRRQQEYAGKLIKCPNCGEVLKSFAIICPACGHELRETKASGAVREFARKLEEIEAHRGNERPRGLFKKVLEQEHYISRTDEQKISLIKSFAIPTNKEDLLEFMILATSSMNMKAYDSTVTNMSKGEREISNAWYSKAKQVYEKAKRLDDGDDLFAEITELYDTCKDNVKKAKRKGVIKWILMFAWIPIFFIGTMVLINVSDANEKATEITRLEGIVSEIQVALDNGEYDHALRLADSLDYSKYDRTLESEWDVKRAYWIDKVTNEATANGVVLTYTPKTDKEESDPWKTADQLAWSPETTTAPEEEQNTRAAITSSPPQPTEHTDYTNLQIETGSVYTYGYDEFNLYVATALSDKVIKVEKRSKNLSTSAPFKHDYDVGTFRLDDPQNSFVWMDDNHLVFTISFSDSKEWGLKKSKTVAFTTSTTDEDGRGSSLKVKKPVMMYEDDDWHIYKAIPLSENLIKIEAWCRTFALGDFHYGYDICIIDTEKTTTDFEWLNSEHSAFAITLTDTEHSNLKKGRYVSFTLTK